MTVSVCTLSTSLANIRPSPADSGVKRGRPPVFTDGWLPGRPATGGQHRRADKLMTALQTPSDGLDVKMLRQQASSLGLPEEEGEKLVVFANLLAAQARLQAETRYGRAEADRADALERVIVAKADATRLKTLADKRYLKLVELRGSVNLRDELKETLAESAAELVAQSRDAKKPRPSALEKWTFIFREAARQEESEGEINLMACCRAADSRLGSAEKAAAAMVRIIENFDQRVHRSLPAEVIQRIGGVAIEESPLLGTQDCKLVERVMKWAAKPCRIVSQEEVDAMLEKQLMNPAAEDDNISLSNDAVDES